MSAIFTPPWMMGNGVGMGTMSHFDRMVHGSRGEKLKMRLREKIIPVIVEYSQLASGNVGTALYNNDLERLARALIAEMLDT